MGSVLKHKQNSSSNLRVGWMGARIVLPAWKCHVSLTFSNFKKVLHSACVENTKHLNFLSLSTLKIHHCHCVLNALVLANPVVTKHLSLEQRLQEPDLA